MINKYIEVLLGKNDKFSTFLNTKVKEYNNSHSIHHKETRKVGSIQALNIIVSDANNEWIGGLTAEIYWGWVEVNDFWFNEDSRGKGLGSLLLSQLENSAKENGANKILLTTFEFQARSFYEIKGFKIVGEIKDYPPGSSYYTMVKVLT